MVLSASESSIKRWVDDGKINAVKTSGGHRRITVEEAIRFIRSRQFPVRDVDLLGLSDVNTVLEETQRPEPYTDRLKEYLTNGAPQKVRGFILWLYLRGYSFAYIGDEVIAPALDEVGVMWLEQSEGIIREHRATDLCIQALNIAQTLFDPPESAPLAVGGALTKDPYILPSMMVSTVLLSEGLRTINLGPDTPFSSMKEAIQIYQPLIFWISITIPNIPHDTKSKLLELLEFIEQYETRLVLGGKQSEQFQAIQHPRLYVGRSMSELTAYVHGLKQ